MDKSIKSNTVASTFLGEIAESIPIEQLKSTTLIFANKRAGIYFLKELGRFHQKVTYAPRVLSFEEFIERFTPIEKTNRFTLIYTLFQAYQEVYQSDESFDNFYFWGEMLLSDFEEIDHQMVDYKVLFKNLTDIRTIEAISFLDEEQIAIINRFWHNTGSGKYTDGWVRFWERLREVYELFQRKLENQGFNYYGRQLRKLAENEHEIKVTDKEQLIFAGFNALTRSEEIIITHLIKNHNAQIFWDDDAFYRNKTHEAGRYMRENMKHPVLAPSFKRFTHDNLFNDSKKIKVVSTGNWSAQIKVVADQLAKLSKNPNWVPEKTAVVIADENLLIPMLNSLPKSVSAFNVTMGLSIRNSPVYQVFELLIQLLKTCRATADGVTYSFRSLLAFYRHPLIQERRPKIAEEMVNYSRENKQYWYSVDDLKAQEWWIHGIENDQSAILPTTISLFEYLQETSTNSFERVFLHSLTDILQNYNEILTTYKIELSLEGIHRLIKQSAGIKKVQLSGEPVRGLQIMGVLETRNIDFEHLFILSLNEDFLPGGGKSNSFIPQSLRKGFQLPTFNDNQAIQSYLFYRLLQRGKDITLIYNANGKGNGGDTSRFIHQLKYVFPLPVEEYIYQEEFMSVSKKISFESDGVEAVLTNYTKEEGASLSPTALYTYLECSLKFFYKYLKKLKKKEDPEEELDARIYGNLLHNSIESIYKNENGTFKTINEIVLEEIPVVVDQVMDEEIGITNRQNGVWSGKYLIVRELIIKALTEIIKIDRQEKERKIHSFEKTFTGKFPISNRQVNLSGKIDRVDMLHDTYRIIDYKTGSDENSVSSIDLVFNGKNKAIFQLFMYSWLFKKELNTPIKSLKPVIFQTKKMFGTEFSPGVVISKKMVENILEYEEEFEGKLGQLLEDIFTHKKFEQTSDEKNCSRCDYVSICRKG